MYDKLLSYMLSAGEHVFDYYTVMDLSIENEDASTSFPL